MSHRRQGRREGTEARESFILMTRWVLGPLHSPKGDARVPGERDEDGSQFGRFQSESSGGVLEEGFANRSRVKCVVQSHRNTYLMSTPLHSKCSRELCCNDSLLYANEMTGDRAVPDGMGFRFKRICSLEYLEVPGEWPIQKRQRTWSVPCPWPCMSLSPAHSLLYPRLRTPFTTYG